MPIQRPPSRPGYGQPALPAMANNSGYATQHDLRRGLGEIEQRLHDQLEGIRQKLISGEARMEDVIRSSPMGSVGGGGCPPDTLRTLGEAVIAGRVLPYVLSIDIPYDKNVEGERIIGEVLSTTDGPAFITNLYAFAQIDSQDTDAQNYPFSLVTPPSCNEDCGSSAFDSADEDATFTLDFGNMLIPGVDMRGAFIPIDPCCCKLISPAATVLCGTLTCPGDDVRNFQAFAPLVLLDHAECLDGVTEIKVNGCSWQNTQFPLALWSYGWSLTNEVPDCLGVGGYLDCQKILQVALTLTRRSRFNVIVTFCFVGFRLVTCGAGSCGIPVGPAFGGR